MVPRGMEHVVDGRAHRERGREAVDELARVARTRWAECTLPKTFRVDKVVFVQNTRRNQWLDLGESALGHQDSRLVGELVDLLAG